jgi:hypothetical protein
MAQEAIFILLFMIVIAVAIIVRHPAVPYSVALVLTGLLRLDSERPAEPQNETKET